MSSGTLFMITTQPVLGVRFLFFRNILKPYLSANAVSTSLRFTLYALRCELLQQRAPCPMPFALCLRAIASRGGTSRLFFTDYRPEAAADGTNDQSPITNYQLPASVASTGPMPYALCPMPASVSEQQLYKKSRAATPVTALPLYEQ